MTCGAELESPEAVSAGEDADRDEAPEPGDRAVSPLEGGLDCPVGDPLGQAEYRQRGGVQGRETARRCERHAPAGLVPPEAGEQRLERGEHASSWGCLAPGSAVPGRDRGRD